MADFTDPATPTPIHIPAWDDVLHIKPRPKLSRSDRERTHAWMNDAGLLDLNPEDRFTELERRSARGEGPPDIDPAIAAEVARRDRFTYRQAESQIPGWRQKMVRVLTVLDNIEDQVSTIEWVTRPITRLWAPTRWAAKVARRTNEVVSQIESVIAGPSIAKYRAKDRASRQRRRSARAASGKAGKLAQAISWLGDNKGHLLEAGQAMDTWAGVGISLGAIFGGIEEAQDRLTISAWNGSKAVVQLAAAAVLPEDSDVRAGLEADADESIGKVRESGLPVLEQFLASQRRFLAAPLQLYELIRTNLSASQLQTENDTYTPAQHALALYHTTTLTPLLAPILAAITDPRVIARIPDLDEAGPIVRNPYSRDLLLEAGATLTADGHPTGEWQSPTRSLRRAVEADLDATLAAMQTWLPDTEEPDDARLLHALTESAAAAGAWTLTGREDGLREHHDPATRAEILMYHLDALPPRGTPKSVLDAWLAEQVAAVNQHPDEYDWRTWAAITARHWNVNHLYAAPSSQPDNQSAARRPQ